jgi:dihydrofolate synthase/folylpolyglutamate synthase
MNSGLFFSSQKYSVQSTFLDSSRKQIMVVRSGENPVYKNLALDLLGIYQKKNVPTVLQAIDCLIAAGISISGESVYEGLSRVTSLTGLRGRWEEIGHNPLIICDTGHNAEGIAEVTEQLRHTAFRQLHIVFGTVNDKDPSKVLTLLPKDAKYYFTRADIPRALDPVLLKQQAETFGLLGESFQEIKKAFEAARASANPEDMIFIGGSTFVVGELLKQYPRGFPVKS